MFVSGLHTSKNFGVVCFFLSFALGLIQWGFKKTHVKSPQQSFSLAKLSLSHLQQFVAPGFFDKKKSDLPKDWHKGKSLCYYRWKKSGFLPSIVAQLWFPIQIGESTSITPDFTEVLPPFFFKEDDILHWLLLWENPPPSHFSQLSQEKRPYYFPLYWLVYRDPYNGLL